MRKVSLSKTHRDRRAVIHCHSSLSHDSNGSIDEITKAARATGTDIVMMTDHPRTDLDVMSEGFSGRKSGVLFIPGAEAKNLLLFFVGGRLDYSASQRDMLSEARRLGGIAFLSHLEEQTDWELEGLNGSEIYNLHASFKMQRRLLEIFRLRRPSDFERLIDLLFLLHAHPDTGLAALCEIPSQYLSAWDRLCTNSRITGIAANDSHANNTFGLHRNEGGGLRVTDYRGIILADLPASCRIAKSIPPGRTVMLTPDSYEISFGHVGTHLLLDRLTEEDLMECLVTGQCYVAFDWIADPRGFSYIWETDRDTGTMGDKVELASKPLLMVGVPAPADLVLKKDGEVVKEVRSDYLEYLPRLPGAYRLEAYMRIAGEIRPWILSNPVYISP